MLGFSAERLWKSSGYFVCISGTQAMRIWRCNSFAFAAAATKPTTELSSSTTKQNSGDSETKAPRCLQYLRDEWVTTINETWLNTE